MKIYIVDRCIDYVGNFVQGYFSTEQLASHYLNSMSVGEKDQSTVIEITLDEELEAS